MAVQIIPDGEAEWLVKFSGLEVFLSYPHLFHPYRPRRPQMGSDGKPKSGKYGAKFCFLKSDPATKEAGKLIHAKIVEMAKKQFKMGLPADRYCLRDGAQLTEDMHPYFVLSASEDMKPKVVDRRRNPVAEEDDLFYAGCIVNGTVRLWAQDNSEFGKRINANLVGVQFQRHSERWGGRVQPKVEDMFDDVADEYGDDEYEGGPTGDIQTKGGDDGFGDDDMSDGL